LNKERTRTRAQQGQNKDRTKIGTGLKQDINHKTFWPGCVSQLDQFLNWMLQQFVGRAGNGQFFGQQIPPVARPTLWPPTKPKQHATVKRCMAVCACFGAVQRRDPWMPKIQFWRVFGNKGQIIVCNRAHPKLRPPFGALRCGHDDHFAVQLKDVGAFKFSDVVLAERQQVASQR
jgi:hypothetical protein